MKTLLSCITLLLALSHGVAVAIAEPIRVGAIVPLTGAVAPWGERVRIGLETANEMQGHPFRITFEDEGACEAKKALAAYRKLVLVDKVQIIFLSCLSGTEAIVPVAAKDSVILLSLGLLNERVLKSGARLVNLATEIGTEAESLAEYVAREKPGSLAGIFFADAFGQEFSRILNDRLRSAGFPFVKTDEADPQIQTFKPLILQWKQRKVDVLVTTLADKQQVVLLKEMKELGFKPRIISSYTLECFAPAREDRILFEGIKYTHPVNSSENSPTQSEFKNALVLREQPNQSTNINAFFAYDGLKFLSAGLSNCGNDNAACLYEYFINLGLRHGVSGEMFFEKSGALSRPYGLKVVSSGEFTWVEQKRIS